MAESKIKVGVVGLGFAGKIHIEKLSLDKDVVITDLCDIEQDKIDAAEDLVLKLSGKRARGHRDYESLMKQDIDAVFIATPARTHYEILKCAIEEGKHIFVEKPLVTSYRQGEEIKTLASQKRVIIQVGHVERFNKAYLFAKEHIRLPGYVRAERLSQFLGRGTDTDVIFDIMIHDIDAAIGFIGNTAIEFVESMGVPVITDQIDMATARVKFSSGWLAEFTASRVSYRKFRKMRIFQPGAYISIDFLEKKTEIYRRVKNSEKFEIEAQIRTFENSDPMRSEIESFIHVVRDGAEVKVSLSEALKSVLVAEKIKEAIFYMRETILG